TPFNLDPANPAVPAKNPFPQECGDPLSPRALWGFANGYASQFHIAVPDDVDPGSYTLDATINADGGLRETSRADDRVQMPVEVIDIGGGELAAKAAAARQLRSDQVARVLGHPVRPVTQLPTGSSSVGTTTPLASGASVDLPDLVPLPSENIKVFNEEGLDLLRFNSTMANLGSGRLQIDGFRDGA